MDKIVKLLALCAWNPNRPVSWAAVSRLGLSHEDVHNRVVPVLAMMGYAFTISSDGVLLRAGPHLKPKIFTAKRQDHYSGERMNQGFSVFNLHCNEAGQRADAEFIAQFGEDEFNEHIKPLHKSGIMAIFDKEPTIHTMAWVTLVTAYVNEYAKESA
jgi:hypothetical protein